MSYYISIYTYGLVSLCSNVCFTIAAYTRFLSYCGIYIHCIVLLRIHVCIRVTVSTRNVCYCGVYTSVCIIATYTRMLYYRGAYTNLIWLRRRQLYCYYCGVYNYVVIIAEYQYVLSCRHWNVFVDIDVYTIQCCHSGVDTYVLSLQCIPVFFISTHIYNLFLLLWCTHVVSIIA